ncbi:MAG: putative metal-dependent hydrolase [Bacteroidia bacterium]|nr:putative metal-dependent hydrolase [Bacteroidia bacterium]
MSPAELDLLRYPIGKASSDPHLDPQRRAACIRTLAAFPDMMREAVAGLHEAQLDTPYRPEGWTLRQVVHHTADSHLNAYIRFRLALTEEHPPIKLYAEERWAELPDARALDLEPTLMLLTGLHRRWTVLLHGMPEADFARTLMHPERGALTLDQMLQLYDWHSRHHLAHITGLRSRMNW